MLPGFWQSLEIATWSIQLNTLERSLERLELAFILGKKKNGNYFYRVPIFKEMILSNSPQVKLAVELR